MAEVIQFPSSEERIRLGMERLLDELLRNANPALRECIKERMSAVQQKYRATPTLSFAVTLPLGVTGADIQPVLAALQREYTDKITAFHLAMVGDICLLEAQLCKARLDLA